MAVHETVNIFSINFDPNLENDRYKHSRSYPESLKTEGEIISKEDLDLWKRIANLVNKKAEPVEECQIIIPKDQTKFTGESVADGQIRVLVSGELAVRNAFHTMLLLEKSVDRNKIISTEENIARSKPSIEDDGKVSPGRMRYTAKQALAFLQSDKPISKHKHSNYSGLRLHCPIDMVLWTGSKNSQCWCCGKDGVMGLPEWSS